MKKLQPDFASTKLFDLSRLFGCDIHFSLQPPCDLILLASCDDRLDSSVSQKQFEEGGLGILQNFHLQNSH
jgi:hypothetical protein